MNRIPSADEEIDLLHVENDAAKVLLSPTIWVKRPVPRFDEPPAKERRLEADVSDKVEANKKPLQGSPSLLVLSRRECVSGFDRAHGDEAAGTGLGERQAAADLRESADKILEGLETEDKENQHAKTDLEEIKAIENEVMSAEQTKMVLTDQLRARQIELSSLLSENESIKRIFASLGVIRSDFDMEGATDGPGRKKRMVCIGRRLVENLNNTHLFPSECYPKSTLESPGRVDDCARDPGTDKAVPMVVIKTPRINARINKNETSSLPVFTPPSHFPEESQIAAAALTVAKGDPAVAMLSLLEKALASRAPSMHTEVHG